MSLQDGYGQGPTGPQGAEGPEGPTGPAFAFDYNSRARTTGTEALPTTVGNIIDLPSQLSAGGSSITWNAAQKGFDISATGVYMISWQLCTNAGAGQSVETYVHRDTGGGPAAVLGTHGLQGGSGVIRHSVAGTVILALNSGDRIHFSARVTTAVANDSIEGTHMTVIKIA